MSTVVIHLQQVTVAVELDHKEVVVVVAGVGTPPGTFSRGASWITLSTCENTMSRTT